MDNQQGPTEQHRERFSVLCGSLDGRGVWRRMDTCICVAESLCHPPETITIGYVPVCAQSLSRVLLLVTPWTVACQDILQYKIKSLKKNAAWPSFPLCPTCSVKPTFKRWGAPCPYLVVPLTETLHHSLPGQMEEAVWMRHVFRGGQLWAMGL